MGTPHKLESSSYQWAQAEGATPESAITWYKCSRCGEGFAHRYNVQPDYYRAAKEDGFDLDHCAADNKSEPKVG